MIKIGLVGCGRISERHFEVFRELKDELKVTAVCDKIKLRADKYAEEFNVNSYSDYGEMLEKENFDLISICTPSGLHPKHGVMAAKKKINVLVEKPIAVSLKGADELIKECDDNNVKLFVVKQNRLNPPIRLLKNAIDKKRFGKLFMANATVYWQRPQEYYDMADWRGKWEFDGGAFMNQASHYVDLIQWLIGPVDYVTAVTGTLGRHIEVEDTGAAILKFRSGAIGVIQVTMLAYPKNYEGSITVLGESGTVKIGGNAVNKVEKWEFEKYDDDDSLVNEINYSTKSVYGFGHSGYYQNVIDVLKKNEKANTDGREGRKSIELILAIYKSAKKGTVVPLPLDKE
jgi:UDP-N-acetyl-2-amino-2-deoxyglucuronate dehydrogenase